YPFKEMTDGFIAADNLSAQINAFSYSAMLYVALLAGSFFFWRVSGFVGMEWLTRTNVTSYQKLYNHLSRHSHSYFTSRFARALSNKVSNASDGVERLLERSLWGWYTEAISVVV